MSRPIVLVPGAWQGAWAWDQVTVLLTAAGHEVHALTLPGLGSRREDDATDIDLDRHVEDVVTTIEERAGSDVVLVGHSYASIVVTGVADRIPHRLRHLIYLDAPPTVPGSSFLDAFPDDLRTLHQRNAVRDADGWWLPFPSMADLASTVSLEGLDPAAKSLMVTRSTAHPFGTWTQPMELRDAPVRPNYDRTLVLCTAGGLTIDVLCELVDSGSGDLAMLAAPDWNFEELPTGHWPMLSEPERTATLLERLAAAP